jgi:hypothetical protein
MIGLNETAVERSSISTAVSRASRIGFPSHVYSACGAVT